MDDIVERLRGGKCPECNGWGEVAYMGEMVGCTCLGKYEAPVSMKGRTEAADTIESLRAENARLTEERDALAEGLRWYAQPHIYAPHPSGPAFDDRDLSWHARSVLAKVKGGPDAR